MSSLAVQAQFEAALTPMGAELVGALAGDGWGVEGIASGPQTAAVGSQAPGFTLRDVQGKSYVVRPGDGKAHLLVFYMGYF